MADSHISRQLGHYKMSVLIQSEKDRHDIKSKRSCHKRTEHAESSRSSFASENPRLSLKINEKQESESKDPYMHDKGQMDEIPEESESCSDNRTKSGMQASI